MLFRRSTSRLDGLVAGAAVPSSSSACLGCDARPMQNQLWLVDAFRSTNELRPYRVALLEPVWPTYPRKGRLVGLPACLD